MCDPVSLSLAAAGLSAGAQVAQGFQANQASKIEQKYKEMEARQALVGAGLEANSVRRSGSEAVSTAIASQSASGVDVNSGSAVDTATEIKGRYEEQALSRLYSGRLRAWQSRAAGAQARYQGKSALTGSLISAGGTLLGGAAQGFGPSSGGSGGSLNASKLSKLPGGEPTGFYVVP